MKWIGQHIYDLISRFRDDVYLEDLSTTTETNVLVVDSDGKISKSTTLADDIIESEIDTLTGSIDPTASTTVTGSGTKFLTELSVGDEIVVSSETRIVTAIASDLSLTVSVATTNTANDATPDCNPVAPVDVILS